MRSVYSRLFTLLFAIPLFTGCVSSSEYKSVKKEADKYDTLYTWSMRTLKACQDDNALLKKQKTDIQTKMTDLDLMLNVTKDNNAQLKKQLQALSAISSAQAESIKKSIDNINSKDDYLQTLQMAVSRRDSINLAVLIELKAAMGSLGDDVHIKVQKGLVNVDFSDKVLFSSDSNSYTFGAKAKQAVGRLARVLNDHPEVTCIIEGNTDSIAYPQDILLDNWDLSVKRSTAIVRSLQNDYNISPRRLTASGHSEYMSVSPNETPEGRATNRRIRAVIVPPTDQLLRLLERKKGQEDEEVPNAAPVAAKPEPPAPPAAKDSVVSPRVDSSAASTPIVKADTAASRAVSTTAPRVDSTAAPRADSTAASRADSTAAPHIDSSATLHKDSTTTTPVIKVDTTTTTKDTTTVRVDSTSAPKDSIIPRTDTTKRGSTRNDTAMLANPDTIPRLPAIPSAPAGTPIPEATAIPIKFRLNLSLSLPGQV